jgi:hypothetical protein
VKHYPFTVIAALCGLAFSAANAAGQSTGGSRIPQQLVGAWTHTEWQMGYGHFDPDQVDRMDYRNQDPVGWTDAYRFFADGSYQHAHYKSLDIPGCDVKTLRQELGWFQLSGGMVRLENRTAKLSAQDRCHGRNNFAGRPDKPAETRALEWRLGRNRNGQTVLLLKGSDGREIAYVRDPSGHI